MFCGSVIVIAGLVVLASQGQTTKAASSPLGCAFIDVILNTTMDKTYKNKTSQLFKNFESSVNKSVNKLFSDFEFVTPPSSLSLEKKGGMHMFVRFALCWILNKTLGNVLFLEDIFTNEISKTGKLFNYTTIEDHFKLWPLGVDMTGWKLAKDGKCDKCSNEGCGSFDIEQTCVPNPYSCAGFKLATNSSSDCVKYCNSTAGDVTEELEVKKSECKKCSEGGGGPFVVELKCKKGCDCTGLALTKNSTDCVNKCGDGGVAVVIKISSFILPVGILLSFSFNIWK